MTIVDDRRLGTDDDDKDGSKRDDGDEGGSMMSNTKDGYCVCVDKNEAHSPSRVVTIGTKSPFLKTGMVAPSV